MCAVIIMTEFKFWLNYPFYIREEIKLIINEPLFTCNINVSGENIILPHTIFIYLFI